MHTLPAYRTADAATAPTATAGDFIRPGEIVEADVDRGCVLVELPAEQSGGRSVAEDSANRAWARLALAFEYQPTLGDEVLVAGSQTNAIYVIGVLRTQRSSATARRSAQLSMPGGARVELEAADEAAVVQDSAEVARLRVFDSSDSLLFEFDPVRNVTRVNVPRGDLEFGAPDGNIKLHAGRAVSVSAPAVSLDAREQLTQASALDPQDKAISSASRDAGHLSVDGTGVRCSGEHLTVQARRSDYRVEQTDYRGERASVRLEQAHAAIDRLETVAGTVISKAANVYRTVTGLTQLQTARMRTLVEKTYQMKARKALVRAETDYKVNARQIHLG